MSDASLRSLERCALEGGEEDLRALAAARLRAGARDPRKWPRPGDLVRVPLHGYKLERWDVRRVVSCSEANWGRPHGCCCHLQPALDTISFAHNSAEVHWKRPMETFDLLRSWNLATQSNGTMRKLGSWRQWAKRGEVLVIADD